MVHRKLQLMHSSSSGWRKPSSFLSVMFPSLSRRSQVCCARKLMFDSVMDHFLSFLTWILCVLYTAELTRVFCFHILKYFYHGHNLKRTPFNVTCFLYWMLSTCKMEHWRILIRCSFLCHLCLSACCHRLLCDNVLQRGKTRACCCPNTCAYDVLQGYLVMFLFQHVSVVV